MSDENTTNNDEAAVNTAETAGEQNTEVKSGEVVAESKDEGQPTSSTVGQPSERGQTPSFVNYDEAAFTPPTQNQKGQQQNKQQKNQQQQRPQPVTQAKPQVTATVAAAPAEPTFQDMVDKLLSSGSTLEVAMVAAMENYLEKMKPGRPLTIDEGVMMQYKLWALLSRTLEESPAPEFNKLWNLLVAYFREYQKGALGGQYVNRFAEYWARDLDHLHAFQQLTNLLGIAANDRQHLSKMVSIHRVVEKGFTEVARGRLISLYS